MYQLDAIKPVIVPLSADSSRFREVLINTRGNITRAAYLLGITKPYAMVLIKKFSLNEWARELRREHGIPITGRPRKPATLSV